ncbi:hypothetical protein [Microcoleus sp. CZ3-B4]|uniref:hypothetical protein n=1 Tax=Microcoleus sp. CZ3-B4 TaxID=2818733 RepID=UPI002FCE7CC9
MTFFTRSRPKSKIPGARGRGGDGEMGRWGDGEMGRGFLIDRRNLQFKCTTAYQTSSTHPQIM